MRSSWSPATRLGTGQWRPLHASGALLRCCLDWLTPMRSRTASYFPAKNSGAPSTSQIASLKTVVDPIDLALESRHSANAAYARLRSDRVSWVTSGDGPKRRLEDVCYYAT